MPGHYGHSGESMGVSQGTNKGPAGGASAGGNYGGDSSGGVSSNQMSNTGSNTGGDRIQRIASGTEPGYRPTDARPHGLAPEEAYRQGKITKDQMNQAMDNPGIDTSGNYQEKVGFWDQVVDVASEYVQTGGLVGNVIKLGGKVLSKLGEYSSSLQKKAMTHFLENELGRIQKKDDFHPGAYGYKIDKINTQIDRIATGDYTQSDFNKDYGSPEISLGGEGGRDAMNMIAPVAPYIVGGTTPRITSC